MNKKTIATGMTGVLLLGTTAAGFWGWHNERMRTAQLTERVAMLELQEKRSAMVRSVSEQMEEIAYEQKAVSDEQREEAVRQKHEADEAKEQAEQQKGEALKQKQEADEAKELAERNSIEAHRQQMLAEQQRKVADEKGAEARKLNYQSLGRLLGTKAQTLYHSGNREMATILAYAAYKYTKENGSENALYDPTVFQALLLASQSETVYRIHNGSLTSIDFNQNSDTELATASSYGEIFRHVKQEDGLKTEKVFSDNSFDFRNIYVDGKGVIFAVSRSGYLVIINGKQTVIKPVNPIVCPFSITAVNEKTLAIVGENGVCFIDNGTYEAIRSQIYDFKVTTVSRINNHPLLFDNLGRMHELTGTERKDMITRRLPDCIKGKVTAFANSKTKKVDAYGTDEGRIYVVNEKGHSKELIGHLSQISRLKFNGRRLYSSSYDGIMNLWIYENEQTDPMPLFDSKGWIMYFTSDVSKKHIWTGDQYGKLTETLISIPIMIERIQKKIRNLTPEEWNHYIGKEYPYELFTINKEERQ